jgi:hypothetical protein
MPTIEVDFDVYKALIARRPTEKVTENDVLRQLLHLPRQSESAAHDLPAPEDWVTKDVRIPAGTELRATYKGQSYLARVENGALVLNGRRFDSPSAAAMSITKNPVNGWNFWRGRLPGQGAWLPLRDLRASSIRRP